MQNGTLQKQSSFFKSWTFIFSLIASVASLFFLFPHDYLLAQGPYWFNPTSEVNITLASFRYYIAEGFSFPLGHIKSINTPEGINILYENAVPLFSLIIKIISRLFKTNINGIYLWSLTCTVLQGVSFAYLMSVLNVQKKWIIILSAIIGIIMPAYLWRLENTTPIPHFFIIFAFAFYFMIAQNNDARVIRQAIINSAIMVVLSYSLNPYITAMTLPFFAATLLQAFSTHKINLIYFIKIVISVLLAMAAIGFLFGYFYGNKIAAAAGGYEFYSMNLLGPVDPGYSFLAQFFKMGAAPINPTGGQQEGMQYLGAGWIFLIILALTLNTQKIWSFIKENYWLTMILFGMFLFSLSNKIYFGNTLLLHYAVPHFLISITDTFRAPGRFFWPVGYFLVAISIAVLARKSISLKSISLLPIILMIAIALQIADTHALRKELTHVLSGLNAEGHPAGKYAPFYYVSGLPSTVMNDLIRNHQTIKQYPSWWCGGSGDQLSEMEINFTASRYLVKQNSFYTARANKDCYAEDREARNLSKLDPNTLYIFAQRYGDAERLHLQGLDLSACRKLNGFKIQPSDGYYDNSTPIICSEKIRLGIVNFSIPNNIDLKEFHNEPVIQKISTSSTADNNLYIAENLLGNRIEEKTAAKDQRFPTYWLSEVGTDGWITIDLDGTYKLSEIKL